MMCNDLQHSALAALATCGPDANHMTCTGHGNGGESCGSDDPDPKSKDSAMTWLSFQSLQDMRMQGHPDKMDAASIHAVWMHM